MLGGIVGGDMAFSNVLKAGNVGVVGSVEMLAGDKKGHVAFLNGFRVVKPGTNGSLDAFGQGKYGSECSLVGTFASSSY